MPRSRSRRATGPNQRPNTVRRSRSKFTGPKIAQLWREGQQIIVKSPYDAEFVSELKETIPYGARKWNPGNKTWSVDLGYANVLADLAGKYYDDVVVLGDDDDDEAVESSSGADSDVYSDLIRGLPMDALKKIYRIAIMHAHPDRGGSEDLAGRINGAWDRIKGGDS